MINNARVSLIQYQRSKYLTSNPISRRLIRGFFESLRSCVRLVEADYARIGQRVRILVEFGCGEGVSSDALHAALPEATIVGFDIHVPSVRIAARYHAEAAFVVGDVTHAPLRSASADLVVMLEVLEHLTDPEAALCEAARVTRGWCIFSVPHEPIWRVLNMVRGAYWRAWGNTPGHINHWSRRGWITFLEQHFDVVKIKTPLPWLMAVCQTK
jgi:SAM-dependent methyltransferase